MKPPCGKACEKREVGCNGKCEKWQEYEAWKSEKYKKTLEQNMLDMHSEVFEKNIRRKLNRRWMYGRNDRKGKSR